jgi:hypothetical protein
MWTRLWDTIHRVTSVEVKFKFIHGEGLRAVLVDGNKPQANTFGADLVNRNKPHLSGIYETEPKRILSNILRTCTFHINQCVSWPLVFALLTKLQEIRINGQSRPGRRNGTHSTMPLPQNPARTGRVH